ncbi:hypothetical protein IU436_25105 [Nocardia farcinica]|uniref:hypothetical protein n=1 Tax=Nocardia farcinica TaxID=37329 RepID=UPI0018940851|nr:hypothetical protein [Nocardia farcinica]MBF6141602.1 hypothetical protein [Nocardia farcinica]MBF6294860.1 hypothetical protein [Nocardia farcinica]MBF6376445.1 hypothetical protein [Nocardia farcinica]MBF6379702.1 hypothetical protein [Nocardia farcinica]MBF6421961.1 hypothetical protein [Nocardia farcinica]
MTIKIFTAAAALAITALTLTDATAFAAPAETPVVSAADLPGSVDGVHNGVGYTIGRGGDGRTLTAALTGGAFRLAGDMLEVVDTAGTVITSVPLNVVAGEHVLGLVPRLADGGTQLVADVSAQDIGQWRKTSPQQRSIEAGIGIGGALGAIGGAIVGMVVGIAAGGLLLPISLPVGLIVGLLGGMAIGGGIGASIPNSNVPDQWDYQEECDYIGDYRYCW